MANKSLKVDIVKEDVAWNGKILSKNKIRDTYEIILQECNLKGKFYFTVCYSNDNQIQLLNKEFRNKNKPTNVLSFPIHEKVGSFQYAGDIILSFETIQKESEVYNISFRHHLTHMIIHGILHLHGFDHIEESDWEIMTTKEIKVLERLKIKNPYINSKLVLEF